VQVAQQESTGLVESLAQRDALVGELQEQVQVAQQESAGLSESLAQQDASISGLERSLTERSMHLAQLEERSAHLARLVDVANEQIRVQGHETAAVRSQLESELQHVAQLQGLVATSEVRVAGLELELSAVRGDLESSQCVLDQIFRSRSWRWSNRIRVIARRA